MKKILLILLILLIQLQSTFGLNYNRDSITDEPVIYGPDKLKLGILLSAGVLAFAGGMYVQRTEYWGNNGEFHIMPLDLEYDDALMADKFGHLYFTYATSKIATSLFQWAEVDSVSSMWIGSGLALGVQTLIEIQDGFSHGAPYLGFSTGDMAANILGAAWPVLEKKYPFMKNFTFKVSLEKSNVPWVNNGLMLTKDYESRYNWVSINIHNMLPETWQDYYPSFVNLALGFSVKEINRYGSGYHELFIALDWNFTRNRKDHFIESFLKDLLNLYHLPSPAVMIYPDLIWYGLKY